MHINECVEIIRVSVAQSLECKVTNPKVQNSKQGQEQKGSTKKIASSGHTGKALNL